MALVTCIGVVALTGCAGPTAAGNWTSEAPLGYTLELGELDSGDGAAAYGGTLATPEGREYPVVIWGEPTASSMAAYSPPPYFISPFLAAVETDGDRMVTSYSASDAADMGVVHLFLDPDAAPAQVEKLQSELLGNDAVLQVTFVSAQEARAMFEKARSERPALVAGTSETPLPSLQVTVVSPTAVETTLSWLAITPAWAAVSAGGNDLASAIITDMPGQWAAAAWDHSR